MRTAANRYYEHVPFNPFAHIQIRTDPPRGTWRQGPYADVIAVIEACTGQYTSRVGWQAFIVLQRFAGFRKCESLSLRKQDVNLTADPMLIKVDCSKTARVKGGRYRVVPVLFAILGQLLIQAIGESDPADLYVVSSEDARGKGAQQVTMRRLFKRAGVRPWKPLFQVPRPSCEYDMLKLGMPEAIYTKAIGHNSEVSRRYYIERFQGVDPDEFTRVEFKVTAPKAKEIYAL